MVVRNVAGSPPSKRGQLWTVIDNRKVGEFPEGAAAYLAGLHDALDYRPSVKEGPTIVARIVRLVGSSTPSCVGCLTPVPVSRHEALRP